MTLNSTSWKVRLRKLIFVLALLLPLKVAFEVSRVQDYRGGEAFVSLSPDGRYKAMRIYTPGNSEGQWVSIALSVGGYGVGGLFAIADASTDEIIAFYHSPENWRSSGSGGHWTCGGGDKGTCTSYRFPYFDEIPLPPSWWRQLHAKLTVKIKDLEEPDFEKITVYE